MCPKCSGEMEYLPPLKHTGFLAYLGSEITFWIVAAFVGGAISCALDQKYGLSYLFGGIAALFVFIVLYRAGARARRGPGLLYCERCGYYRSPGPIEGFQNDKASSDRIVQ
jgi:hypothetical protein